MAKCRKCGKKGLLLKLDASGLCAECAALAQQKTNQMRREQEAHTAKLKAELEHQNRLLDDVLKAREEYSEDGDITKAIDALEEAIIKAEPPLLMASGHTIFLIDLYKKSGQNDKAWGLLNSCIMDAAKYEGRERLALDKVRTEMAKILKSEKKYSAAVEMYLLAYLHDAAAATTTQQADNFEKRFRKNIKPCVSKLKWDEDVVSDLIEIVQNTVVKSTNSIMLEGHVLEQYRDYLEKNNL